MRGLKKVLIAPDKFKDAATAEEVSKAIQTGIHKADLGINCTLLPLADGGEGTLSVLQTNLGGEIKYFTVRDPLFREIKAPILFYKNTAYIEMASASGLQLLKPSERNCYFTTSYGTGQLLKYAIQEKVANIIIGLGGSATCDGGMGMAEALGFEFTDEKGKKIKPIGKNLIAVKNIKAPDWIRHIHERLSIKAACDVNNPLHGTEGSANVFASQKGATVAQTLELEKGLLNFDNVCSKAFNKKISNIPGTGAAGGISAGLNWFLDADLCSGAELIMQSTNFTKHLTNHQIVITGEGSLDRQSLSGKVIQKISEQCNAHQTPVFALCGKVHLDIDDIKQSGLQYAVSIANQPASLEQSLTHTLPNLEIAAYNLIKALTV